MKNLILLALFLFLPTFVEAKTVTVRYTIKTASSYKLESGLKTPPKSSKQETVSNANVATGVTKTSPKPLHKQIYTPVSEVERLICFYFGEDCGLAVAVARAESGLRANAVGDGGLAYLVNGVEYGKSYGVFQIRHLPGRPSPDKLMEAEFNVQYAYNLYKRSGFNPWSAYTNRSYLKFL